MSQNRSTGTTQPRYVLQCLGAINRYAFNEAFNAGSSVSCDMAGVVFCLTLHGHIKTTEQYSNTVTGTLAVYGWAVTFGTVRRGLGRLQPHPIS